MMSSSSAAAPSLRQGEPTRRERISNAVESAPFCVCVALLTVVDVLLFLWQISPHTSKPTRRTLRSAELGISSVFVGELVLRCWANERETLLYPPNVADSVVILLAFGLSAAEVSTPLVAARLVRLIRFSAAGARCGRAARSSSRSAVEMRVIMAKKRTPPKRTDLAATRAKQDEDSVTPLLVDVTAAQDLAIAVRTAKQRKSRTRNDAAPPRVFGPLSSFASQPSRAVRDELDKAATAELYHKANASHHNPHQPPPASADLEEGSDASSRSAQGGKPHHRSPKRETTSAHALAMLLEHCLAEQAAHPTNPPPIRLREYLGKTTFLYPNERC